MCPTLGLTIKITMYELYSVIHNGPIYSVARKRKNSSTIKKKEFDQHNHPIIRRFSICAHNMDSAAAFL